LQFQQKSGMEADFFQPTRGKKILKLANKKPGN